MPPSQNVLIWEYYKSNNDMMQQIRNVALEEQAVEFVLDKAKVTEKESSWECEN